MEKGWSKGAIREKNVNIFRPRHGNNLNIHRQRSGSRRGGTYTQWNITQPLKRTKYQHS